MLMILESPQICSQAVVVLVGGKPGVTILEDLVSLIEELRSSAALPGGVIVNFVDG